ncbi:MAG: radical SAM protein [Deltaproteobacteria bacterium HGW-Deltaproteobacteria-21]|nr:MAG: radical SAM protein [Deltaproteobacteria bacterium HGW-Deltaproteobacteria-21]
MAAKDLENLPFLLFSDSRGRLFDHPRLRMAGFSGNVPFPLKKEDLIPLPEFSKIFFLPECRPIGVDPDTGEYVTVREAEIEGDVIECFGAAAFLEPGFVRTHLPAAEYQGKTFTLPMWGYSAVGYFDGQYWAPGFQIEYNPRWDPRNYDDKKLVPAVRKFMRRSGNSPLADHLANCATSNHCFAAKNLFLGRWEAPLPVSRRCNARCLGCLSLQPGTSCAASHHRIAFRPTKEEIVALAVEHLDRAPEAIVSFGQGCEGEPLTEYRLIAESIREIRRQTSRGTINLNTNGSFPERVRAIAEQGLDSIRISMNSAQPELYRAYYRPRGYGFGDVVQSISLSREKNLYTMVNYLIFPGITDQEMEIESLIGLVRRTGLNFLHLKNLNIDPQLYIRRMPANHTRAIGMKKMVEILRRECPGLELGYFNKAVR